MIVRGRVVDAEGRPVAGARIVLDHDFAPMPAVGQKGKELGLPRSAATGPAGEYAFDVPPENRGRFRQHSRALRAFHGDRVSQCVVIDWTDAKIEAADLVLGPGVTGQVRLVWEDGSRIPGVELKIMISEHARESADPRAGLHSFEGTTDEQGELSFGPVPDVEYQRIAIKATHPDAPVRWPWWDDVRLTAREPIEFSLPRGLKVRGQLRTSEGAPAAGYRVAALDEGTGDPGARRAATADGDGRFEVQGVGSAIAIYAAVPRAESGDLEAQLRARMRAFHLGHPLLIRDVPPGCDDLGTISIPLLGTLTVRFEDERGAPVRGAMAWWHRADVVHGGGGCRSGPDGILRSDLVPLGTAIVLRVTFEHPQHGKIEQAFEIPEVTREAIALTLTGAGTVVFRLHPAGAPEQPLSVSYASFGEDDCHGAARDGPLSELRWWTWPGFYPSLHVDAVGFRKRVIENVTVRADGPTYLDVELEPR